jgi:hypothetical protein
MKLRIIIRKINGTRATIFCTNRIKKSIKTIIVLMMILNTVSTTSGSNLLSFFSLILRVLQRITYTGVLKTRQNTTAIFTAM